uniref:Uncharacterized protein n=1 Tax=Anguilla anguilla TaxID=7936 RepID=A0A0E9WFS5_ANGAN
MLLFYTPSELWFVLLGILVQFQLKPATLRTFQLVAFSYSQVSSCYNAPK